MKLNTFNGGLNTSVRPQYIEQNQGSEYVNIDSDAGCIVPLRGYTDIRTAVKEFFTYFYGANEWVSFDARTDFLEFQGKLYLTDRLTRPQVYDGTTYSNLGIDKPLDISNVSASEAAGSPANLTGELALDAGGDLPQADLYYLVLSSKSLATLMLASSDNADGVQVKNTDVNYQPHPPSTVPSDARFNRTVTIKGWNGSGSVSVYRQYEYVWRKVGEIASGGELVDSVYDISSGDKLDKNSPPRLKGTYSYLCTFYNSANGQESAPSKVSDEVEVVSGGFTTIFGIPQPTTSDVDKIRLYRVGGELSKFRLVAELDVGVTQYEDRLGDTDVTGDTLVEPYNDPAPDGLAFLCESYTMLFGAVGHTLRFTPVSKPWSWPESYFIDYDDDITAIAPVANGVLVFTRFKTHIVLGNNPLGLSPHLLSSDQGCLTSDSLQYIGTSAVWVSTDGVCTSNGNRPEIITKRLLGKVSLDAVSSAVHDEVYYVVDKEAKILAIGDGVARHIKSNVTKLANVNDKLLGWNSGRLYELNSSTEPLIWSYTSPLLTEGSLTKLKNYKKFFISSKDYVKITIIIDGKQVFDKELDGEGTHQLQIPVERQRGHSLQVKLEGTGEVYEIDYTVGVTT